MQGTLDWVSVINIVGVVNGLFLTVVVKGVKKGDQVTKNILSLLLLTYSLVILGNVIWQTRIYHSLPFLIGIFPNLYFLIGPLLYFYVKALTSDSGLTFKKKDLLHLAPGILNILYLFPYYFWDVEKKIRVFEDLSLRNSLSYHIILVIRLFHISVYLIITIRLLKEHQNNIKKSYSFIEKIQLSWIKYLIFAIGLLLGAYVVFYILSLLEYFTSDPFSMKAKIFSIWQTVLLFFIGYQGLVQPEIFSDGNNPKPLKEKYKHSRLTNQQANEYLEELLKFMQEQKPYLNSELTLKELANKISISHFFLSQIINEKLNQNFFDFVNRYRVEEAKRQLKLIKKSPHATILKIAFDSGFNSKSTFNMVFKKIVKMTPSQFMEQRAIK
jgi:AraC-like DNA-binding protein